MSVQYKVRIAVARVARKAKGVPVRYIDDVGEFRDDGAYVTLAIGCVGQDAEILVIATERFYEMLGKVMRSALPAFADEKLS